MTNVLFYVILLAGSLAFGLEALLIGLGGKLIVMYRGKRWFTLWLATCIGLSVVVASTVLGVVLNLEPLYVCGIVLLLTFAVGEVIALAKPKLVKTTSLPLPPPISDKEITRVLKKRGFKSSKKK